MRRQVWSSEEIRDVLLATAQASGLSQAAVTGDDESAKAVRAYCQGFNAALVSLSIAFGLAPTDPSFGRPAAREVFYARDH